MMNVYFACKEEGSSNRNANRDESVKGGYESTKAGQKAPQSYYDNA